MEPPSVWSVARHLGVKVSLDLEREHLAPADAGAWNLPPGTRAYHFPLAIRMNGQPALIATLVVAPARPPLLACGGIVGLLAERPNDKDTYLTLRIISAHSRASPCRKAALD